jgi:stage V sporulation protein B
MALSEPIMTLLYPLQEASAVSASRSLFLLATGVIFLCIAQAMAGILQGLGHPGVAVYGLLTGLVVKTISTYILTGIPSLNVEGAAIGSSLGFCAIGLFNLLAVRKLTGITFDQKISVWKPLIAGAIMFLLVVGIYQVTSGILGNSISTLLAIGAGAAVYGILLIRIRAISPHEIRLLPKGEKLERLLIKFRLIREEKK